MMLINEWEAMERGNKIAHINVLSESVNVCSSNLSVAFGFQSQHNNFIPCMYSSSDTNYIVAFRDGDI